MVSIYLIRLRDKGWRIKITFPTEQAQSKIPTQAVSDWSI